MNEMYQIASINMTDALTEESSQDASVFDENELIGSPNTDMIAAQLASAGQFPLHVSCCGLSYVTSNALSRVVCATLDF